MNKVIGLKLTQPLQFLSALFYYWNRDFAVLPISSRLTDQEIARYRTHIDFELITQTPLPDEDFDWDQVITEKWALIIPTSGSTGDPKLILHTFSSLIESIKMTAKYFEMRPGSVTLVTLPHHHIGGLMSLLRAHYTKGNIFSNDLSIEENINSHKIDFISLVPTQIKNLIQSKSNLEKLKNIKTIFLGGDHIDPQTIIDLNKNSIHAVATYGMTETASMVATISGALPGVTLKINPEDQTLLIHSKTLALGQISYKKLIALNQVKIDGVDFFKTNDMAETNANSLKIIGRTDQIFISGGNNISPREIEDIALKSGLVDQAIVVAKNHESLVKIPVMFVRWKNELNQTAELYSFLKSNLINYKVPRAIMDICYYHDVSSYGKINRNELIKQIVQFPLYDSYGDKNNPVIFFWHGMLGDRSDFIELVELLQQKFYCVIIDLPGFGDSSFEYINSRDEWFFCLNRFIKKISGDHSPYLYAYSMGGRMALEYISFFPGEFAAVFIESSHIGLSDHQERLTRQKEDSHFFDQLDHLSNKEFLTTWYSNPMWAGLLDGESKDKFLNRKISRRTNQLALNEFYSLGLMNDCLKDKNILNANINYIYGELDHKYKELAVQLKMKAQKWQFDEIKNAGHNCHAQNKVSIIDILLKKIPWS